MPNDSRTSASENFLDFSSHHYHILPFIKHAPSRYHWHSLGLSKYTPDTPHLSLSVNYSFFIVVDAVVAFSAVRKMAVDVNHREVHNKYIIDGVPVIVSVTQNLHHSLILYIRVSGPLLPVAKLRRHQTDSPSANSQLTRERLKSTRRTCRRTAAGQPPQARSLTPN